MIVLGLLFAFEMPAAAETAPAWRTHLPIPIATLREIFDHWDRELAGEPFVAALAEGMRLDHPDIDGKTWRDLQRYVQTRFEWSQLAPLAIDLGLVSEGNSERLATRVLLLYAQSKGTGRLEWDGIVWPATVLDARAEPREDIRPSPVSELDIPVQEFNRDESADELTIDAPQGIQ